MPKIHLVIGPVGAGKSTFALQLCEKHHAVRMNLDEWMAVLFRPDRPEKGVMEWYVERTQRCIDLIWTLTTRSLDAGTDVVLEIGLIQRHDRERLYGRIDAGAYDLHIYVVDAPRDVRRERVLKRNRERGETFSMEVPMPFFELASDRWEPLSEDECEGRAVRFFDTSVGAANA